MGHTSTKAPRHGTLQFWPRVRAKRQYPRIGIWADAKENKLLGFCGYKAGMTHVIAVDNRPKSSTKGEEIRVPATIIETPSLFVCALRLYSSDFYGTHVLGEIWADDLPKNISRKLTLSKKKLAQSKLKEWESNLDKVTDVRVLVLTNPLFKKTPELMEMAISGENKFEYAKSLLGKDVGIDQVFQEGQIIDIHAITTGKGYQGVIKRFGLKLKQRKSEKGQRRLGTLGNWDAKTWRVAHGGQMGYHTRTEYNKLILKMSNEDINPNGGIPRFGLVKGNYILVKGSVAGPKKRLIRLNTAIRTKKAMQAPTIMYISRSSQV